MHDSVCKWRIAENAKILRSYTKHSRSLPRERNTESRLVYADKFSSIFQSYFLTETTKQR